MSDLGNLLQMIYDLLTGWLNSFTSHAAEVMEKLNLIEEDTDTIVSNTSDIADDTNDIKDNTGAIITPVQSIKSNTDSIKNDTTSIKNNVSTMTNQLGTISTNVGTASAFTEDVANNTLDIKDKVVTIASDTTQIRSNTNTVVTDMDKVYEALKWALVDKVTTETEEGTDTVSFDTDLTNDLVSLEVGVEGTQSGTGVPSPSNIRTFVYVSDKTITVNGNSITISLGQSILNGILDVINGILTITSLSRKISTFPWTYYTDLDYGYFATGNTTDKAYNTNYKCECLNPVDKPRNNLNNNELGVYNLTNASRRFVIRCDGITDVNTLNSQLGDYYISYELATPTTVTLTPSQIATIKGINTIITDGNINVTYEESVKHYIDKQEA